MQFVKDTIVSVEIHTERILFLLTTLIYASLLIYSSLLMKPSQKESRAKISRPRSLLARRVMRSTNLVAQGIYTLLENHVRRTDHLVMSPNERPLLASYHHQQPVLTHRLYSADDGYLPARATFSKTADSSTISASLFANSAKTHSLQQHLPVSVS
jgi:hypothetical protein